MNGRTPAVRPPRRRRPRAARTALGVIAAAGLALLAAACGGSSGSHVAQLGSTTTKSSTFSNAPGASAQQNGALAFSRCVRFHGVPSYPDPSSGGLLPKKTPQQLGVSSSEFQAAQSACIHGSRTAASRPRPRCSCTGASC
jgi:hypothetical protein